MTGFSYLEILDSSGWLAVFQAHQSEKPENNLFFLD
jgi:hypothetical protein